MNTDAMNKIISLIRLEAFEELQQFIEMLESDRDFLKEHKQTMPTHQIIQNYIDDLNEIINKGVDKTK